jgi:DNA-binding winged helix-turn-helix (wHTH) protein
MTATFGTCELSLDRVELRRDGAPVATEPQVFDVLAYLLTHRDRVVSKQELLDEVWGTRFVSESALTSRIKSARRAVGDNGRDQSIIRTVHGRGYRFVAEVEDDASSTADDEPFELLLERVLQCADPSARHSLRAVAREIAEAAANAAMAVVMDALAGLEAVPEARAS